MQEPGAKNHEGNTPLHYACLNGHVTIVKQLMMTGASASELNRYIVQDTSRSLNRTAVWWQGRLADCGTCRLSINFPQPYLLC